jgi:hypothetical protein
VSAWDVVLGSGVALASTVVTQMVALGLAGSQRKESRRVAAEQYDRTAVESVQESAKAYRTALVEYGSELASTANTSAAAERALQEARMDYQALVHRCRSHDIVQRLSRWETAAVAWSQGEGGAAAEDTEWNTAMMACGHALRATFR